MSLRRFLLLGLCCFVPVLAANRPASGQVCNVKVVSDASPDYYDIQSLIHSSTSKWQTPQEKCWALFYWNHINRRQTAPLWLHGVELADPIMQWNDYGFTMCSTICGINCSVWDAMGMKVRHWEIQNHTVPEVFYDGRWHMYDNSMSALYTLCDGVTIAGVEDIGKTQACPASGGKAEFAHIAKYHCLNGTGKNGLLTGADCNRDLKQEGICFNPNKIQNCNDLWWDRGHRYILNLRPGEVYTRWYHRLDADSAEKVLQSEKGKQKFEADPAYFVANMCKNPKVRGKDAESANPRYRIRGNGIRSYRPSLAANDLAKSLYSLSGAKPGDGGGLEPAKAGTMAEAIFKVEGANVITSMTIKAALNRKSSDDVTAVSISTSNGMQWKEAWRNDKIGEHSAEIKLIEEVNGSYEVLVKVQLLGKTAGSDAQLKKIDFQTVTQVNSKALPRLNIGKNTIYVGIGDQSEAVLFWPDLRGSDYRRYAVAEQNIVTEEDHPKVAPGMHLTKPNEEGFVVFRLQTPRDITRITYGGRIANRGKGAHVDFLHSFDHGKTWTRSYALTDANPPWDVIHYETVDTVPAGVRSVLFKYLLHSPEASTKGSGLFAVRMEADYQPADQGFRPLEVTWTWKERQEDYSLVERSHTQLIESVPCRYTVNVGGADHPEMEAVRIHLRGAAGELKYGYSGPSAGQPAGKDVEAKKFVPFWATYGTNFAEGKSYTLSIPSSTQYKAGDKEGQHKLTDGIAWCAYGGGLAYSYGGYWGKPVKDLRITVDLEQPQPCRAFRIHVHGWPWYDAIQGEFPDKVEVLTSTDNQTFTSRGFFNFKLRWKDLPVNFMWPDSEQFQGHLFDLILPRPVEARYVQFQVNSPRSVGITELQALGSIQHEPFDLRVALPDEDGSR